MLEICQTYARIGQNYARIMVESCQKYARVITEIC
jgi:hypothetical protein